MCTLPLCARLAMRGNPGSGVLWLTWWAVLRFELRLHLGQPLLYVCTGVLMLMLFLSGTGQIALGSARVHLNAPAAVAEHLLRFHYVMLFLVMAFVVSAASRDRERKTTDLFLSKPVSGTVLASARAIGAVVACLIPYLVGTVALAGFSFLPDIDPQRLGPFRWSAYGFAFGVLIAPTLVAVGTIAFALAIRLRHTLAAYVGVVLFFGLNLLAGMLSSVGASDRVGQLAQLLDPYGVLALGRSISHWSAAELNSDLPPLAGLLLWNRVLWVTAGIGALLWALRWNRASAGRDATEPRITQATHDATPARPQRLSPASATGGLSGVRYPQLAQWWHQTWRETTLVLRSRPFLAMLAIGLAALVGSALTVGSLFGMPMQPRTARMLEAMNDSYDIVVLLTVILLSGEMVWRERAQDVHELMDATPTPTVVFATAKLLALWAVVGTMQVAGVLALMAFQVVNSYTDVQPGLYLQAAALGAVYPALMAVLALTCHVIAGNRATGYGLVGLFVIGWDVLEEFGFEHHLYRYASVPAVPYSEFNGFGHFAEPFVWFAAYWACWAAALVVVSLLLWPRGTDRGWRARMRAARARWNGRTRAAVLMAVAGACATGGWSFYNANVRNTYRPSTERTQRRVAYEQQYGRYAGARLPRVTSVRAQVDVFPRERRLAVSGWYGLHNRSSEPVAAVHISIPEGVVLHRLELPAHTVELQDDSLGYRVVRLHTPLQPGDSLAMGFSLGLPHTGFEVSSSDVRVVGNGSFFTKRDVFPVIGFDEHRREVDPGERRRVALPPLDSQLLADTAAARHRTPRAPDADRVSFDVVISTDADQRAVTSGERVREWVRDGRRYAQYIAEHPITHHFAFASARYAVATDTALGVDLQVYHHPAHADNAQHMLRAARQAVERYTAAFGPYRGRSLRLVEFPQYVRDGTAFPGMIALSENMGFTAQRGAKTSVDYAYYTAAHEVAHQWWGQQVVGADLPGVGMLHESLAQYSALLALESAFGREAMRAVLAHEHEWYWRGRASMGNAEPALAQVRREEPVSYHKGALALYALRDAVGEARINHVLSQFLASTGGGPPYPTAAQLVQALRRATPDSLQSLVTEWFDQVVTYDVALVDASVRRQASGRYVMQANVDARAVQTDSAGREHPLSLRRWVDVAAMDANGRMVGVVRTRLRSGTSTVELEFDALPAQIVLDPWFALVDRNRGDNTRVVRHTRD